MCKCDPSIRTPFCRRGDCFPPSEKGFKKRELDVVELEAYDAGYLSSYGEGNVQWWHDYMRAELERARTFYEQQVEQMLSGMAIVPVEPTRAMCKAATSYTHSHDAKLIYKAMLAAAKENGE